MKDNEFNNIKLLVRLRSNVETKPEKPPKEDRDPRKPVNPNDKPGNSTNNKPPRTDSRKPKPQVVPSKF